MGKKKEIEGKIDDLFEYRQIPWLLELAAIKKKKTYLRKLKELQSRIYDLDQLLETNWTIKSKQLEKHWQRIHDSLAGFGIKKKDFTDWTRQILRYQDHELSLRKFKSPLSYSKRYLYFYKSCDVKLIRKLIYKDAPSLKKTIKPGDWTAFDLITEVNDDIEDLFEDMNLINGNSFLFSLKEKGKARTKNEFLKFINKIKKESNQRFKGGLSKERSKVSKMTKKAITETVKLLDQRFRQKKVNQIHKALIFTLYK